MRYPKKLVLAVVVGLVAIAIGAPAQAKVPCVGVKDGEVKQNAKIRFRDVCKKKEMQLDLFATVRETRVCTVEDASAAEALAASVQTRYDVGVAPRKDVLASRLLRYDFQWCAGEIDKDAYCTAATTDVELLVGLLDAGYTAGVTPIEHLLQAHRDAAAIRALCD